MAYTGSSIVDYLKSVGEDSSFATRKKKAESLGISDYKGTAEQNLKMLDMLRSNASSTPPDPNKEFGQYPAPSPQKEEAKTTPVDVFGSSQTVAKSGITAPTSGAYDFFGTAVSNVSPERKRANELLDLIFENVTKPVAYDPGDDELYQEYRRKMKKDAEAAYGNINAEYLGSQGGNFNTAAQQIASAAKNELLDRANLAMGDFADRFYSMQQKNLADQFALVNSLLGLDESDYGRAYTERRDLISDTGYIPIDTSSIPADSQLRQIPDYSVEIAKRQAENPDDPLIPILEALRYEKVMSDPELFAKYGSTVKAPMGIQTAGTKKTAFDQAMASAKEERDADYIEAQIVNLKEDNARERWKALGKADAEVSKVLGVPVGTAYYEKPTASGAGSGIFGGLTNAEFDNLMAYWKSIGKADKTVSQYLGVTEGTPYGGETEEKPKPTFGAADYYKDALDMKNEMVEVDSPGSIAGKTKERKYTDYDVIDHVIDLGRKKMISENEVQDILSRLGYTDQDLENYLKKQSEADINKRLLTESPSLIDIFENVDKSFRK